MKAVRERDRDKERDRVRERERESFSSAVMPIMSYLYQRGRVPHSSGNLNQTTLKRKLWENWPLSTHHPCTLCCSFSVFLRKKTLKNRVQVTFCSLSDIMLMFRAVELVLWCTYLRIKKTLLSGPHFAETFISYKTKSILVKVNVNEHLFLHCQ